MCKSDFTQHKHKSEIIHLLKEGAYCNHKSKGNKVTLWANTTAWCCKRQKTSKLMIGDATKMANTGWQPLCTSPHVIKYAPLLYHTWWATVNCVWQRNIQRESQPAGQAIHYKKENTPHRPCPTKRKQVWKALSPTEDIWLSIYINK